MQRTDDTLAPRLRGWIDAIGADRWAALVLDAHDRLVWISDELESFLGEADPKMRVGSRSPTSRARRLGE